MLCIGAVSRAQLTGTITVPSTTYPDLASAITALNTSGVGTGGVTVNLTTGNPQTAPTGGYKLGSATLNASVSATKTITINGNGNTVTAYTGTSTTADGIFFLQGTDYVTINGLNLTDPATNTTSATRMEWGFVLCKLNSTAPYDGCQFDKINGCTITMNNAYASATGINLAHIVSTSSSVLSATGATQSDANSNNQFTGNTFTSLSRGIYAVGINNSGAVPTYDMNNQYGGASATSGNTFVLGGTTNTVYGVYTQYDSTVYVRNNNFSIATGQNATVYMFYPSKGVGDLIMDNNTLNFNCSMASATVYGMYNSNSGLSQHGEASVSGTNVAKHSFSGNTVYGNNPAATSSSIYVWYDYYGYCGDIINNNNNISNISWGASTGSIYTLYNYYNGANNLTCNGNVMNNLVKTGTSGYIYGPYNYQYNTTGNGLFTVRNNKFRNWKNNYYIYTFYNYATYQTGAAGHLQDVSYNRIDSIDISGSSSAYLYNYLAFYGKDSSKCTYDTLTNLFLPALTTTSTGGMYNYFGYFYYAPLGTCKGNYMNNVTGVSPYVSTYMGYYAKYTDSNAFNNFNMTGTSGSWYLYMGYYPTNGFIRGNSLRNFNAGFTGFYNYIGYYGTGPAVISNNRLQNLNLTSSGSMYNYFAYYMQGAKVFNNVFDTLTLNTGTTLYGMYSYAYGGNDTIYNNRVSNLKTNANSASIYPYYLGCSSATDQFHFYNNAMSGIEVPATFTGSALYGIYTAGTGIYKLYNNTVRINPSIPNTSAGNFGATGIYYTNTGTLDLRNNIINVNVTPTGSGVVAALRRSTGTTGVSPSNFLGTSNSNIYYAPNVTNSFLYVEGTSVNGYNLNNDPSFNTSCGSLFKNFIGHEQASFTENNLTASAIPGVPVPSGISYAEGGGAPTLIPAVTTDIAGNTRSTPTDIGALEFSGTATDNAPPQIGYTPVPTTSYCTSAPIITATITDQTGVNNVLTTTSPAVQGTAPRLYYKKTTDANTFGANNNTVSGWKYVEPSISGNQYTFSMDYSLLTSTVVAGNSIQYFIIAQDTKSTPNAGTNIALLASCPTTVQLTAANAPVATTPAVNAFTILTTPTFTANALLANICVSGSTPITLNPFPVGATIQWESATLAGTFSPITGATGQTINTGTLTSSMRYRAVIYCSGTSVLATTSPAVITVSNPAISSTTGASRCGYGPITLTASANVGTTVNWYTTATGTNPKGTGTTFKDTIGSTTTYYAAAVVPKGTTELVGYPGNQTTTIYSTSYANAGLDIVFDDVTDFYSTTIYPNSAGTYGVELQDATGNPVSGYSSTFTITNFGPGKSTPTVLNLNWLNIPAGTYRIAQSSGTTALSAYEYYSPQYPFPYLSNITGRSRIISNYYPGIGTYNYYYFFFYNNIVSGPCENPTRYPVVASVNTAPSITASSPNLPGICAGGSATITATSSNGTYTYAWAPNVIPYVATGTGAAPGTLLGATQSVSPVVKTKYYVYATDVLTGCTAVDSVLLNVNPQQGAPTLAPQSQTICEKSVIQLTATPATSFGGVATVGTGTTTIGQYAYPMPLGNYYTGHHDQYLIKASELIASGMQAGAISSIAFDQVAASQSPTRNLNIRIAPTTLNNLPSSALVSTGMVQVATYTIFTVPTASGWVTVPFNTSSYNWNGTDNLIVDISENNCTACPSTSGCNNPYLPGQSVNMTVTSFVSSISYYGSSDCNIGNYSGFGSSTYLYGSYATYRPNMRFNWAKPYVINWTNVNGLYKSYPPLAGPMTTADTNRIAFASPVTTQIYRVVTNAQGCISALSAPDTLFVNPAPNVVVTPAGNQAICSGQTVTLSVPTGGTYIYQWYVNGSPVTPNGTGNTLLVTTPGSYRVAVTNLATGCADTSIAKTVIVNALPSDTITASGPTTFCNGGSVVLTSASTSTPVTYQWYNASGPITGATSATYTATTSGNYYSIATNINQCTKQSNTVAVTVNTIPNTVTPLGSTAFCTGGSVTLSAPTTGTGTPYTYLWYYNGLPAGTPNTNSTYTATAAGSYYVVVSSASTGCTSQSATTTVTVGAGPSASITPSGPQGLCAGDSLVLTSNTAPGLTYDWLKNGTSIGVTTPTLTVKNSAPTGAGTYTVKVTIASQPTCSSTTSTSGATVVTINPLPTVTISNGTAPTTFCAGGNVNLTASSSSATSYQWYNNSVAIPGAIVNPYSATTTGSYVAVGTTSLGCRGASNAISVTVNPLPVVTATPASSSTFCAGGSVTINGPAGLSTYQWKNNGVNVPTGGTSASYTATATGLYTLTATNGNSCSNTSIPVSVQANPAPDSTTTPTAGNANICQGGTITLKAAVNPNYSYQWQRNGTNVGTGNSFTATTAGSYTVKLTNTVTGCTSTSQAIVVIVNAPPTATATRVGPPTICAGDSTLLTANTGSALKYQWNYNGVPVSPQDTFSSFYAKQQGNYSVTITNIGGCSTTSANVTVTVNPTPAAFITYNTPLNFCEGSAVVLNANTGISLSYIWLVNGTPSTNVSTSYIANTTGIYSVKTTNSFGCSTISDTLRVTANPKPAPVISRNGSTLSTVQTYANYQWFFNNVAMGGETNQSLNFTQNGAYKVRVIDANGCEGFSELIFVQNVGVTPTAISAAIKVYPNPTANILHVDAPVKVKLTLRDVTGKVVLESSAVKEMDLTNVASGMYLLYISDMSGKLLRADKVTKTTN